MQKRIVGFITVMFVAFELFLFYVPVQAAEFTADWFNTRQSVTNQGKIYVKDGMICIEVIEGPELGIIIADQGKRLSIVMLPDEKIYIEIPKNLSILEPDNDVIMGAEKKLMGTETVNGRSCDKYQYFSAGTATATITQWIAKDLKYPVKTVYHGEGGSTAEVKNIKEGPVDEAIFQVRPGYTKKEVEKVGKLTKSRPVKKVNEFSLKGEGRDMDMTSIEKNVQPGRDLMIIIQGDSRYRLESKGKFSLFKGTKREKVKEIRFALKPGEEKLWDFAADREIKSVSFGVYGKGEIKVRTEQGAEGKDQAGHKGQMTAAKEQPGQKPIAVQQTSPDPSGSFASLIDDIRKSYNDGDKVKTIKQLKAAVKAVWDEIPLTVIDTRLVKDTNNYVSRDSNVYRSGEKISITSQILGYTLKKVGESYSINLTMDFYVLDENGNRLGGKENYGNINRLKAIPVTDFDMDLRYTISYPKGLYTLETVIHDQNSGKSTKFNMEIEIR